MRDCLNPLRDFALTYYFFPYFGEIFPPIRSFSVRFSAKNRANLSESPPKIIPANGVEWGGVGCGSPVK